MPPPEIQCGSGLAREGGVSGAGDIDCAGPSRASPLPQGFGCTRYLCNAQDHCGSEPARDGGVSGTGDAGCAGPFAGRPAPTIDWGVCGMCVHWRSRVGADLLAKAVGQAQVMLAGLASSRAGQLPQGFGCTRYLCNAQDHCGSGLARDGGLRFGADVRRFAGRTGSR